MIPDIQFTKRFHKDAKSRAFSEALPTVQKYLDAILQRGPMHGKSRVKQLIHGKKGSIWRIKISLKTAAPHRLLFEWISHGSSPTLLLLCFTARKDKQYDNKHASVFESLADNLLEGQASDTLKDRIFERNITPVIPPEELADDELEPDTLPAPSNQPASPDEQIVADELPVDDLDEILEEAQIDDLIELYASKELIHKFAAAQGWGPETCAELAACDTTDEAVEFIQAYDDDLEDVFLKFILDDQSTSDLDRIRKVPSGELGSIAERPLSYFMLTVDPEQQAAIERPIGNKPFMVRGSAGTGKSVVCLYRLKRMLQERTNESLEDLNKRPGYLFLSYTNALVENARALFEDLTSDMDLRDVDLKFSTLDYELFEIAGRFRDAGHTVQYPDRDALNTAYWSAVRSSETDQDTKHLLEAMGLDFFAHEVEEVLIDKQVSTLDQYLEKGVKTKELRKGLVVPMTEKYRKAVWLAYRKLEEGHKRGSASWGQFRSQMLELMVQHPELVPQYNVVFSDEVQDFGDIQMKLITKLCSHPSGMVFASDIGQTIYRRQSSLSEIDETLQFNRANSVILKRSYRMTQQISTALRPLRQQMAKLHQKRHELATPVYSGNKPLWIRAPLHMQHARIAELVRQQQLEQNVNLGQFAVLFCTNRDAEDFYAYCQLASGITATLHTSNKSINLEEHSIHLLTAHSAKGLEFPHVIVPFAAKLCGAHQSGQGGKSRFDLKELEDSNNKLLYVACSRASENLTIIQETNTSPSALGHLNAGDWEIEEHPHEEYRA